ncbi:MAG: hypothetical protein K0U60_01450 [Actinomycetia bacterium]|nr:hypothetical protein [Actinomycetes bacterium]MCH9801802.1 hypothetical protein [Actinomycetes bacterium]
MSIRARVQIGLAAVLAIFLAASVATTPDARAGGKVKPEVFSLHAFSSQPGVPGSSLRLNCTPLWRDVQPQKGTFVWDEFDNVVSRDRDSWGYGDLMYVPCGTPEWAGGAVKQPNKEVRGFKSTAPPKKMKFYEKFMTKVVKRYKGKIRYYQTWNEITSPQFFQGSPKQAAKMTKILHKVVKQNDSKAKVVSASVQTHTSAYRQYGSDYLRELNKLNWPVKFVAGHFYPLDKGGPDARVKQIQQFKQTAKNAGMPKKKKIWDTEANFWTSVVDPNPAGKVRGKKAATYLARNFLDTIRLGLKRSYWYHWTVGNQDLNFPGVQLRTGDPATTAWQTLYGWIVGTKYQGCDTKGKLVRCNFKGSDGKFQIAFTTSGKTKIKTKGKEACPVNGGTCQTNKKTTIKTLPKRIA